MMANFKSVLLICCLILQFVAGAESFQDYFYRGLNSLYTGNPSSMRAAGEIHPDWAKTLELYHTFWQSRLNNFSDSKNVISRIEKMLDKLPGGLTYAEKELYSAVLCGMQASLEAQDGFFSPLKVGSQSLEHFQAAATVFPLESAFGSGAAHLTAVLFFDNNLLVQTLLGFDPSLNQGVRQLNQAALYGKITRVEALLFLNEYYAGVLMDYKRAVIYSELLIKRYPANHYFNYLHGRNLFQLNRFAEAADYLHKSSVVTDHFYPFQYESLILEAESYYYRALPDQAVELTELAGSILAGQLYYDLKFRLLVLQKKSESEIRRLIEPSYAKKLIPGTFDIVALRRLLLLEISARQAVVSEDILTMLPGLNSLRSDFIDRIVLTMQEIILNLNTGENEVRRLLARLGSLLQERSARASGELLRFRHELYCYRYDQAGQIYDEMKQQYPALVRHHADNRRIAIWQRIISAEK